MMCRRSHSSTCLDVSIHRLSRHSYTTDIFSSHPFPPRSTSRLAHSEYHPDAQDQDQGPHIGADLTARLLSMPILQVVIDIVRSQPLSSPIAAVEKELVSRLAEEIVDPESPWFELKRSTQPIPEGRGAEHYSCAIEIALAARSGLRNERKMVKFWKKLALQTDPSAITPSPSDVSDTGISPNLSRQRQELLDDLVKRRTGVDKRVGRNPTGDVARVPFTGKKRESDGGIPNADSHEQSFDNCVDTTLVNTEDEATKAHPDKVATKSTDLGRRPSNGSARNQSLIPRRSGGVSFIGSKSLASSEPLPTSVQSKRLLFENMNRSVAQGSSIIPDPTKFLIKKRTLPVITRRGSSTTSRR